MNYNSIMKKLCVFFAIFVSFCIFCNYSDYKSECNFRLIFYEKSYAKSEVSTYAKALPDCVLYKSKNLEENYGNVLFIIPETYFVTVIEKVSDECMKVQYGDYVGYIDSSKVIIATFIPIVKTLESIWCNIKETSGTQVWSKPTPSSEVLATIPAGTKNLVYIASVFGSIPGGGESNLWHYVRYTPANNSTNVYEGYVYSENVTDITEIQPNLETNPEVIPEDGSGLYQINVPSTIRAIIISVIAIPVIILILILISQIAKTIRARKDFLEKNRESKKNFVFSEKTSSQNDNGYENEYNGKNIKNEIENMTGRSFVRKIKRKRTSPYSYPDFPEYDSDDDLL